MGPTDPLFALLAVGLALALVRACRRWRARLRWSLPAAACPAP